MSNKKRKPLKLKNQNVESLVLNSIKSAHSLGLIDRYTQDMQLQNFYRKLKEK